MESSPVRYRYGRLYPSRQPKTCIATCRLGDFVFFGISRCNKSDVFKKTVARQLATDRLSRATTKHEQLMVCRVQDEPLELPSFYVSADGTFGFAHLCAVNAIFNYFDQVDPEVWQSRQLFNARQIYSELISVDYGQSPVSTTTACCQGCK